MILESKMFDLSKEESDLSQMMYGKIIKCLVAPYHTKNTVTIPWNKNVYLYPETEASASQCKSIISLIAGNPSIKEAWIITTNMDIIRDMYDGCVRVLTEDDKIVSSPVKTFCANPHTIIYELLENKNHQISSKVKNKMNQTVTDIISDVQKAQKGSITKKDYDALLKRINMIGEHIISDRLKDMLSDVKINGGTSKSQQSTSGWDNDESSQIEMLEKEIERLKNK